MNITEEIKRREQHLNFRNQQATNIDSGERLFSALGGLYLVKMGFGAYQNILFSGFRVLLPASF